MATDGTHTSDRVRTEPMGDAYISPTVDFLLILFLVSVLAVATVAIILP